MRSPRKVYAERVRDLCCTDAERYIDMAACVRVYRRGPDGLARRAERLPWAVGGRFDRLSGRYVGPPTGAIPEIGMHPGQVRLLEFLDAPGICRVLGLGSPGSGKTEGIIAVAALLCVRRPSSIGGIVAPTRDRLQVVWRKFLNLVTPFGWVLDVRPGDREVFLRNGTIVQFVAAKRQSSSVGSPIAGRDWHWAVEDEQQHIDDPSLGEVDARGRINADYKVFSSAANEPLHEFQLRLRKYGSSPNKRVVRFSGYENVFTPIEHWDRLKRLWGVKDFERKILCLDVPEDGRVYPEFSYRENLSPIPELRTDSTPDITREKFETPYDYVVGTDFGRSVTASIVLRAWRVGADVVWYAEDELTTRDKTTEWHARDLLRRFGGDPKRFIVLADPHVQAGKDTDDTDYTVFRKMGINVMRANYTRISKKHRWAMVNSLLNDACGKRRLFLHCDSNGQPKCVHLAEALGHLRFNSAGEPETNKKGSAGPDLTHWPDALGYGLFRFESIRGIDSTTVAAAAPINNGWYTEG